MKIAPTNPPTAWVRLSTAARRHASQVACAAATTPELAPPGFATRVVARAGLRPQPGLFCGAAFERLAARALGCACACALAVAAWDGLATPAEARAFDTEVSTVDDFDPVGDLFVIVQTS